MMHPPGTRTSSRREPVAATQTRQVRVMSNILTNKDFSISLFECVSARRQKIREFAQGSLINVENHDVVGGL
jgi:hypothetical protein